MSATTEATAAPDAKRAARFLATAFMRRVERVREARRVGSVGSGPFRHVGLGPDYHVRVISVGHYAIWLVAIPQDDARAGTATFEMAWRDLVRDLGDHGIWIALAFPACRREYNGCCGWSNPWRPRLAYVT